MGWRKDEGVEAMLPAWTKVKHRKEVRLSAARAQQPGALKATVRSPAFCLMQRGTSAGSKCCRSG